MLFLCKWVVTSEEVSSRPIRFIFDAPIMICLFNTDNYNRTGDKTKRDNKIGVMVKR